MTLAEFLETFNNPQAVITVTDSNNTELIKFYAAGYEQLLSTLLDREVDKVTIVQMNAVTVLLKAV